MTALMLSASVGDMAMVQILLDAGADPELQEEVRERGRYDAVTHPTLSTLFSPFPCSRLAPFNTLPPTHASTGRVAPRP